MSVTAESAKKNVSLFNAFYEENKDKILMDEKKSYPIDTDALMEWTLAFPAKKTYLILMAQIVSKSLRHVGFEEFYGILRMSAVEIAQAAMFENKKIVLVITDKIKKSNTWVALLVWSVLREQVGDITHIVDYVTDAAYSRIFPKGVFYVHVDDASYSGLQISLDLSKNLPTLDRSEDRRGGHSEYYILAAAISETARNLIQEVVPVVKFPQRALTFKNMYAHAKDLLPEGDTVDQFFKKFRGPTSRIYQFNKNVHALYFDHKLPDGVSIIQKILALAPVLEDETTGTVSLRSIIKGCDVSDYTVRGDPVDGERAKKLISDFDYNGTCPRAFYKTITYTFKNVPLVKIKTDSKHILDYLHMDLTSVALKSCISCKTSKLGCSICKKPFCGSCFKKHSH